MFLIGIKCVKFCRKILPDRRTLEKIDQNHTKIICWKCDGFVMVSSEKPAENHHFS